MIDDVRIIKMPRHYRTISFNCRELEICNKLKFEHKKCDADQKGNSAYHRNMNFEIKL